MKNTTRTVMVLAAALVCIASTLTAQNTIIPAPLQSYKPTYWNGDVFSASVPTFALGHQWGGAALDKINTAFKMNVTGGNWGYLHLNEKELYKLGTGYNDTNYVVWAAPLMHTTEGWIGELFRVNWYGMRWEPAENAGTGRDWQARDADAWPFGFAARHHGTIPASSGDVNYRRFKLDPAGMATNPMRVLDSVEPRTLMRMWYYDGRVRKQVNWADYLGERFASSSTFTGGTWTYTYYDDSTDGRRLQLVVNLRRTDPADTILDDQPVVSITIPYQLRWKDQNPSDTAKYQPNRFLMPFTRIPWNDKDSTFALPRGRGLEMKTRAPGGFTDSIVITRRMLPRHSDPGGPDVTIVAEFRTDTIKNDLGDRLPYMLKSGVTDFPAFTVTDASLEADSNFTDLNKRYRAIDSLGVTVWYHGNSAVAIRSASLLTPITKRATSGYHDSLWASKFEDHRVRIKIQIDTLRSRIGRHTRVLAFYTNDEFEMDQLLGMRYKAEFLDRRLTSETGYMGSRFAVGNTLTEYGRQKMQGFPTKFPWTAGLTQPTRATAAPYVSRGSVNEKVSMYTMPVPSPIMSLKSGFLWAGDRAPYRRFETDISTKTYGPWAQISVPFPTTPNDYTTLVAYEDMMHSNNSQLGPIAMQEHAVYTIMYQNGDYFFAKRRSYWMNFFYHVDPKYGYDSSGRAYVRFNNFQPLTGEAVRLGHGTALNLGTRGFMYDKWKYQDHPDYDIPHPDSIRSVDKYGHENFISDSYFPGYVTESPTAFVMDTTGTVTPDDLLKSEYIGGDYFTVGDRINLNDWTPLSTLASEMRLSRIMPGDVTKKVYAGRLSVRWETKWWHDLVTDTTSRFKRGTDLSNAALFMKTRPIGWFGKGYRNLLNGDTLRLQQWVDAYPGTDFFKVKRWARTSSADTTLRLEAEPLAEQFFDVVLLDTSEASVSDDNCVIAITNRRSSPFLFNASMPDSVQFLTSYEHDTLTRGSRPDLRYKQVGARRITIPFNYSVDITKPYLLHVRELRPSYDGAYTIDTIVSGKGELTLDLRPGDTRFLRIKRLQAIDTMSAGYLAFSGQNKMIAYRMPKADFSGYTDSIRYHAVFHRKDTDPMRTGPWTVYYQRSKPYHRDSLPLVSGLDWETPIRLSGLTTSSVQKTDGLNRTLYYDVDPMMYLANVPPMTDAQKDCSCGFPSLVVRDVAPNTPKVFVVYTCEDEWIPTAFKFNYFHVVENAFLDQGTLNPVALNGNGKSLIIAGKDLAHDGGMDTLKSLARYGTPVINASAQNRMYYAWSAVGAGIGAGMKLGTQDWFPAANAVTAIPTPTIPWYYNHDNVVDTVPVDGGAPRYPSLNVYSNIAQGRTDATLVWQEGAYNQHIRYTRLIPGAGTAIARMLPDLIEMSYDHTVPPSIPVDAGNAIAIIGGASPDEEAELPVVVRSLQQDTMSMFIRDEDGSPNGLIRYNHETVSWAEWTTMEMRNRIRYNHLIDRQGFGANELHYWWTNTTYSDYYSLFHPVLTNGDVRLDSLTWQGMVGGGLVTYADSLHIVKGNLSDSAIVVNYSVLDNANYQDVQAQKLIGSAAYWTGYRQFPMLRGQQITVARMPGIPAPPTITLHYDFLRAAGAWPHVAMRQRENMPTGMQSVRRILQYTNQDAPSLLASAEQFYKLSGDDESVEPASSGGFQVRGAKVTTRAVLSDGRTITMKPVYQGDVIPQGYTGSVDYAWQMASMTRPVTELVSEPFRVGDVDELKVISSGALRTGVDVSVEEVELDVNEIGSASTMRLQGFREPARTFRMALAAADERRPEKAQKALYYLTSGRDQVYRLRMKYTGRDAIVYREDMDITPEKESFEKTGQGPIRVIDLSRMSGTDLTASADLQIFPNPSTDRVTIIVAGSGLTPSTVRDRALHMDIADAIGNILMTSPVTFGEAVDVQGLPNGVYAVRIRLEGTMVAVTGRFTVVR